MKTTVLWMTTMLLALGLAGCTNESTQDTELAHLTVKLPDGNTIKASYEPAAPFPSLERHTADGATHPGFYTAFDLLVAASNDGKLTFAAAYDASLGYYLNAINGVQADPSYQFWSLTLNGEDAMVGMGQLELRADDTTSWEIVDWQDPPGDEATTPTNSPGGATTTTPGATVMVPESVTKNASVMVEVEGDVVLSIDVSRNGSTYHTMETEQSTLETYTIPLQNGTSTLRVTTDDGNQANSHIFKLTRLARFTFQADYGGHPDGTNSNDEIWMDVDAFVSMPAYEDKDQAHPGYASVHDVMVTWEQTTGNVIGYTYGTFGFGVETINDIGQPLENGLPPWWCYKINGSSAELGATLQSVSTDDTILWYFGACN